MKLSRFNHWLNYRALSALAVPLLTSCFVLTGCFGGTAAQQLVRAIFIQGADKATAAAVDAHNRNEKLAAQYQVPKITELNDYQIIFLSSGFEYVNPQIGALPQAPAIAATPEPALAFAPAEPAEKMLRVSKLVYVEVWNLLLGDEKQHQLEKASLQGSPLIPPREEWSQWYVAVGSTENVSTGNKQAITFLIPPEIGKMRSGARALVELPNNGELSIARYALN
jgi:hypothetical protein